MFRTESELIRQIKIHQRLSVVTSVFLLIVIIAFGFSVLFIYTKIILYFVVCFCICVSSVIPLILISKYYKKEMLKSDNFPYEIILPCEFSFEKIKNNLSQLAKSEECRDFSDKSVYFCFLNLLLNNRLLLIKMNEFNKNDFDSIKKKINKSINDEFHVSQWESKDKLDKMIRTNIIVTDEINDSLYRYISNNTGLLLSRAEGIINFAVVGNRLIIPPVFGETDERYKRSIQLMKKFLL